MSERKISSLLEDIKDRLDTVKTPSETNLSLLLDGVKESVLKVLACSLCRLCSAPSAHGDYHLSCAQ